MKRKERINMVRKLLWTNRQISLQDIAQACGVSLRTTYRDLHSVYSHPVREDQTLVAIR
jgi:DeoR/GlpR family transcriptional regulator of sugar metabolism